MNPTTRILLETPEGQLKKFLFVKAQPEGSFYFGSSNKTFSLKKSGTAKSGDKVLWSNGDPVEGVKRSLKLAFHLSGDVHFTSVEEQTGKKMDYDRLRKLVDLSERTWNLIWETYE